MTSAPLFALINFDRADEVVDSRLTSPIWERFMSAVEVDQRGAVGGCDLAGGDVGAAGGR